MYHVFYYNIPNGQSELEQFDTLELVKKFINDKLEESKFYTKDSFKIIQGKHLLNIDSRNEDQNDGCLHCDGYCNNVCKKY